MTKLKRYIVICIVAAILAVLCAGVTLAWFIDGVLSDKLEFHVAYVDSQITLYRGEDFNHDGQVDIDSEGEAVFTELGDSNNGSIKLDASGNPIYSGGKPVYDKDVAIRFAVKNIMPTQVFTWKMRVQNLGDVKAVLYADFVVNVDTIANNYGLDVLSVAIESGKNSVINKDYFALNYTDASKSKQLVNVIKGDVLDFTKRIPGSIYVNPDSIREYIIKIEFESLQTLKARGISLTQEEYQAYAGRVINDVNMIARLEDGAI